MPGSPVHLFRRFLDVAAADALSPGEVAQVETWLSDPEAELFFAQPTADQRHGYQSALTVLSSETPEVPVIRAALLHDVGKRHSSLGILTRSIASILIALRVPLTRRMTAYHHHGPIGADELADAGSEPLVVEFARHHHGSRPDSIDPAIWSLLRRSDEPPKARSALARWITWFRR